MVAVLGSLTSWDDGWVGWIVGDGALLGAVLDSDPFLLGCGVGLGAFGEGGRSRALYHTSVEDVRDGGMVVFSWPVDCGFKERRSGGLRRFDRP